MFSACLWRISLPVSFKVTTPRVRVCPIAYQQKKRLYQYRGVREPLDDPRCARDLVLSLRPSERVMLHHKLQQVLAQSKDHHEEEAPTRAVLRKIVLNNTIPFVGFGFLDNVIMILAGDYFDSHIGALLGISTMAAAAWGNLVSDVFGLALAGYIEGFAAKLGLASPDITPKQSDMLVTRTAAAIGRTIGIVIGCVIGMFPLLFLSSQ